MISRVFLSLLTLCPLVLVGQIDGDNIFSVDQVIALDLTFPQDDLSLIHI